MPVYRLVGEVVAVAISLSLSSQSYIRKQKSSLRKHNVTWSIRSKSSIWPEVMNPSSFTVP